MTSERLGREGGRGAFQTCEPTNFAQVNGGQSEGSSMRRPGSEDPHWRERNLLLQMLQLNYRILNGFCPWLDNEDSILMRLCS